MGELTTPEDPRQRFAWAVSAIAVYFVGCQRIIEWADAGFVLMTAGAAATLVTAAYAPRLGPKFFYFLGVTALFAAITIIDGGLRYRAIQHTCHAVEADMMDLKSATREGSASVFQALKCLPEGTLVTSKK